MRPLDWPLPLARAPWRWARVAACPCATRSRRLPARWAAGAPGDILVVPLRRLQVLLGRGAAQKEALSHVRPTRGRRGRGGHADSCGAVDTPRVPQALRGRHASSTPSRVPAISGADVLIYRNGYWC
eukprot:scaffold255639_cov28-Tisochrysis_lutea.AAC.1